MKVKKILTLVLVVLISLQVGAQALDKNGRILPAINTQTQSELNLKANLNSPTFTGTLETSAIKLTGGSPAMGKVLTSNASGLASWAAAASTGIPYTGATGAVDLGAYDLTVNTLTIGIGGGSVGTNTAIGVDALRYNTTGLNNIANGFNALYSNDSGSNNTAIGRYALYGNTNGSNNTAIGANAFVATDGLNNATAIGANATVAVSNTIQLGNTAITNVSTSGTLTAGAITIPNTDGTSGQVLATNGAGILSWSPPSTQATSYSGILPLANGGTGSATQNFVDLTTIQTVAGAKTFSEDIKVRDVTLGYGGGNSNSNLALGISALAANTTGQYNTAFGGETLKSNIAASNNTAVGHESLLSNIAGAGNTALGRLALKNNLNNNNTAIGLSALVTNTTGYENTALGSLADVTSSSITNATAIGYNAKVTNSNTIQLGNANVTELRTSGFIRGNAFHASGPNYTSLPGGYLVWNLLQPTSSTFRDGYTSFVNHKGTGSGGFRFYNVSASVDASTNPIVEINASGTITANSLSTTSDISVNAVTLGLGGGNLNSNLALGIGALAANTTGTYNTAAGSAALGSNIAGAQNSAFGYQALKNNLTSYGSAFGFQALMNNTTGLGNTAVGYHSLKSNTTGFDNTAIGQESLLNNLDGERNAALGKYALKDNTANDNTAVGYAALQSNTTGDFNVAVGKSALAINQTGTLNTAVGAYALPVSKDSYNTAIGVNTLYLNTYGSYNTAVGRNALYNNNVASTGVPGGANSAFGNEALMTNTTGYYNTAIGATADVLSANLNNATAIGYGAIVSASNTIQLGNTSVANVNTGATMNALSFNSTSDVRLKTNIVPILDGLSTIMQLNPVHYNKKNSLASTDYSTTENGFIAQELQKIIPFVVKEGSDTEKLLSVNYTSIIPILTKAIQEQQTQIEAQNTKLDALEVLVKELIAEKK